jgi:RNA polymerase sigma factor (sigma-70 family)
MIETPRSLLERLQKDSAPADWKAFVDVYSEPLFRYARKLGLPNADALDVVQNLFLILIERLPGFVYDPSRSFTRWLMTMLRNKANDYWREKGRRPPHLPLEGHDWPVEDESLEEREFAGQVARTAFRLLQTEFDSITQTACQECWMNGRRPSEVAAELGVSADALQSRLARARRKLAEMLRGLIE